MSPIKNFEPIKGTAEPGDGRGRQLGFPTANLTLTNNTALPKAGVYAALAKLDGEDEPRPSAVHIGPRPTFDDPTPTVEVHLLNFPDQDLYGRQFTVQLVEHIRDIKKFESPEALSKALKKDCQRAQAILEAL